MKLRCPEPFNAALALGIARADRQVQPAIAFGAEVGEFTGSMPLAFGAERKPPDYASGVAFGCKRLTPSYSMGVAFGAERKDYRAGIAFGCVRGPTPGATCDAAMDLADGVPYAGTLQPSNEQWFKFPTTLGGTFYTRMVNDASIFTIADFYGGIGCPGAVYYWSLAGGTACIDESFLPDGWLYCRVYPGLATFHFSIQMGTGACP